MGKYIKGNLTFPATMNVERTAPLDDRLVVETLDDLTNGTIEYPYEGMVVNVRELGEEGERHTEDLYVLVALPANEIENWKRIKGADEIDQEHSEIYDAISTLNDDLRQLVKDTVDRLLDDEGATEAMDSFKEVADWCSQHLSDVEELKRLTDEGLRAAFKDVKDFIRDLMNRLDQTDKDIKDDIAAKWEEINGRVDELDNRVNNRIRLLEEKEQRDVDELHQRIQDEHDEHSKTEARQDDEIHDLRLALNDEITNRESVDNAIWSAIAEEARIRESVDGDLNDSIWEKYLDRIREDQRLQGELNRVEEERVAEDFRLQDEINRVEAERVAEDQRLQEDLNDKYADRVAEDFRLQDEINRVENERVAEDGRLQDDINQKYLDRILEDQRLQGEINQKEIDRIQEDQRLQHEIEVKEIESIERDDELHRRISRERVELDNDIADLHARITRERKELDTRDNDLQRQIDENYTYFAGQQSRLDAKIDDVDSRSQIRDNNIRLELQGEQATRIAEDDQLRFELQGEQASRIQNDEQIRAALKQEEETRISEDNDLWDALREETRRSTERENFIETNLNGEISNRISEDAKLKRNIDDDKQFLLDEIDKLKRLVFGDGTISETFDTIKEISDWLIDHQDKYESLKEFYENLKKEEAKERSEYDAYLEGLINEERLTREREKGELDTEIHRVENERITEDERLESLITKEVADRKLADTEYTAMWLQEKSDREAADRELYNKIEKADNDLMYLYTKLRNDLLGITEIRDDEDFDAILDDIMDIPLFIQQHRIEYAEFKKAFEDFVRDEVAIRSKTDADLRADLTQEIQDRTNEISRVDGRIDKEITDRENEIKRIEGLLSNEETARKNADKTLQDNIDLEETTRIAEDTAIRTDLKDNVDRLDATDTGLRNDLTAETNARMAGDTAIHTRITNVEEKYDLHIKEAKIYKPEIVEDHWVTEEIGDIPTGLHKDDELIHEHSICYILDKLLYKTVQPEVTEPSISMSYRGNDGDGEVNLIKVGANLPAQTDFLTSCDRGTVSYTNAAGNKYYTGAATESLTISKGSFGSASTEGIHKVVYNVNFAAGADLKDNKTDAATVAKYPGGELKMTKVFHVCLPIYANTNGIGVMTEQDVVDYYAGDAEVVVSIPAETSANKFELYVPSHLNFTCHQYAPTGSFTDPITLIANGTTTYYGVTYNKYVRTTDANSIQAPSKYKVVIENQGGDEGGSDVPPVEPDVPTEPDDPTYVDLGLPSGNLWATCNLGAEDETDYGLYFQWGDTKGYEKPTDRNFYFPCKYIDYRLKISKYCNRADTGTVDLLTALEPEDDAATVLKGGTWRTPSYTDVAELFKNTESTNDNSIGFIINYKNSGINGVLRRSKINSKTIFFPASGYFIDNRSENVGERSYFWTRDKSTSDNFDAYAHNSYGVDGLTTASRWNGIPVRAIKPAESSSEPIKLDAPVLSYKLTGSDSVLVTWEPVENADYYEYEVDVTNESGTTEETKLSVTNLIMGEPYKVTVAACSNNEEFEQSEQVEVNDTQPDVEEILNYFKPAIKTLTWGENNSGNKSLDFYFPPEALELSMGLTITYHYNIDNHEQGYFSITNGWTSLTPRHFNYKTPAGQHTTVCVDWELTQGPAVGRPNPVIPEVIWKQIKGEVTYDVIVGEDYHMED